MNLTNDSTPKSQLLLPSQDLTIDLNFFTTIGFRLDQIFPADNPAVAIISGYGLNIRLDKNANCPSATIYILTDEPELFNHKKELLAPNGTTIKIFPKTNQLITPPTQHKFEVRRLQDNDPWVIGRAGMLYRDLIPDRLGGSIIASHIHIPTGGPVPDMVHYHTIGFQLIFCYNGWVKLVYEDQGPPFILHAGDCVTQPPEIRHRVLESSDNLEVIEIGVPAEHLTTIDHDMELPTPHIRPDREFQGQCFCHHQLKKAVWEKWATPGFEYRETGIYKTTNGVASVQVVRPFDTDVKPQWVNHKADIYFTFIMQGKMELNAEGQASQPLKRGDAYVIPPHLKFQLSNCSENLELLLVLLPGDLKATYLEE